MKNRVLLPFALQVILDKPVDYNQHPSAVNLCFFAVDNCISLHYVVAKRPYLYDVPCIVAYPLPWRYLPFYELSISGVLLKILVLPLVKAHVEYEIFNHLEQFCHIKGPAVVYLVMINNYFYMSHDASFLKLMHAGHVPELRA